MVALLEALAGSQNVEDLSVMQGFDQVISDDKSEKVRSHAQALVATINANRLEREARDSPDPKCSHAKHTMQYPCACFQFQGDMSLDVEETGDEVCCAAWRRLSI